MLNPEQTVLRKINSRTGLKFTMLAQIDTGDQALAEAVLPVLQALPVRDMEDNIRNAIYGMFGTPHASPYVDTMIGWWQEETESLGSSLLTQALAESARPEHAERLWQLCQSLPRRPEHYMLVTRLAKFPATEHQVKDKIVEALASEELLVGDLEDIASVDDPRIRRWFSGQLDSPNRDIRNVAKRVVERGRRLPREVRYASTPPERESELFSAEVDIEELVPILRQVIRDHSLKVPAAVRKADFLGRIDIDRWVVVPVLTKPSDTAYLWFRLEDVDVVEIVLTPSIPNEPELVV